MLVTMGRSRVGEMGLCVDLSAHASGGWGWQKSSSTAPHFILWGRVSQWTQSSWLWLFLLRTPSLQVQVACPAHPAFTWDLGSWTPILPPTQEVLNHWTILSQSSILFLGFVGSVGWVGGCLVLFSSLLCFWNTYLYVYQSTTYCCCCLGFLYTPNGIFFLQFKVIYSL